MKKNIKKNVAQDNVVAMLADEAQENNFQFKSSKAMPKKIYLSVVIPIYNEAGNIECLCERLFKVLDDLKKTYEIIFINDGSRDKSMQLLLKVFHERPEVIKIIDFQRNFGQHMAVMAGFEQSQGEVVITLDADLQNPPEEIPKLLDLIEQGYDFVSGYRIRRQDSFYRKYVSKLVNIVREKVTNIHMTDEGCMLRAYSREVIDLMVATKSAAVFIPTLAYSYAANPTEVAVKHEARFSGTSKYRFFDLIRLYFNLMTSTTLLPLQMFTAFGVAISFLSFLFFIYLILRRLFVGPEVEGVFTLFAILFFLIGILLMGLGITGEYIGRIYQEVRQRPRFAIRNIIKKL